MDPRGKFSRPTVLWVLRVVLIDLALIARVAKNPGTSWRTVNSSVLEAGRQLLSADPIRFDGVRVIGADEDVWRHIPSEEAYVTVVIDLTPILDVDGPVRASGHGDRQVEDDGQVLAHSTDDVVSARRRGRGDRLLHAPPVRARVGVTVVDELTGTAGRERVRT